MKLPGSIYQNGRRWWWKVRLTGEDKIRARPLRPAGAKYATTDRHVAEVMAKDIWQRAVFAAEHRGGMDGTIAGLVKAYLDHATTYYRHADGRPTTEIIKIKSALRHLIDQSGQELAEDFGPVKLAQVRDRMIAADLNRTTINAYIGIICRVFKWGAEKQCVPGHVPVALRSLAGLRRGRSEAKDTDKVTPIAVAHVRAVLPYASPTVAAMIQVQLLTAMRSQELVLMRPCDIDQTGVIWLYRPTTHKTAWRGQQKVVAIGTRCQAILTPFLRRKLDACCFSPNGKRRGRYTSGTYRRAVTYAIRAARKAGHDVADWTPHQLRHAAATLARQTVGLDAARAMLGQRSLSMADDYAELDQALAVRVASKIG